VRSVPSPNHVGGREALVMTGWDYALLTVTVDNSNRKAPKYEAVAVSNGKKLLHHQERGDASSPDSRAQLGGSRKGGGSSTRYELEPRTR